MVRRPDGPGQCLRQVIAKKGIEWQPMREPYTLSARPTGETTRSRPTSASNAAAPSRCTAGYRLSPDRRSSTRLLPDRRRRRPLDASRPSKRRLAEGRVGFAADQWHKLKLCFAGARIRVGIDGATVGAVEDFAHHNGMAGLGSGWNTALYANFAVHPIAGPDVVKLAEGRVNLAEGRPARASSKWSDEYDARFATDGDGSTRWNSAPDKTAGEWLEVNFGRKVHFDTVCVRQFGGRIHRYKIRYAVGGGVWRDATTGDAKGRTNWTNRFAPVEADKLRLLVESVRGNDPQNDTPSVYELEVYHAATAPSAKASR